MLPTKKITYREMENVSKNKKKLHNIPIDV